jgi:DNA polymerase III alpha subunit (gram-positive type)
MLQKTLEVTPLVTKALAGEMFAHPSGSVVLSQEVVSQSKQGRDFIYHELNEKLIYELFITHKENRKLVTTSVLFKLHMILDTVCLCGSLAVDPQAISKRTFTKVGFVKSNIVSSLAFATRKEQPDFFKFIVEKVIQEIVIENSVFKVARIFEQKENVYSIKNCIKMTKNNNSHNPLSGLLTLYRKKYRAEGCREVEVIDNLCKKYLSSIEE